MNDQTKPIQPPPPLRDEEIVKPPSVLLLGDVGTGKTTAIATLLDADLEVFVLITEANGLDSLLDAVQKRSLPVDKLHWHYVPPAMASWDMLERTATQINSKDYKSLSETLPGAFGRDDCRQIFNVINTLRNFVDDRTGESFGDPLSWGDDRAFVLDSMSGLNDIIRTSHLGFKPTPHMGEWGTIMNYQLNLLKTLTASSKCFLVVTAHIDKEPDQIEGGSTITTAALGSKNAPQIARLFSEIVLTKKSEDKGKETVRWSTADARATLKHRGLSFSDNLLPSFVGVVDAYKRRLAQAKTQPA